jgi:NAD+--dinitrogen-reductase ADP-D-ribosyltransferase
MTVAALRGHSANLVGVPTGLLASAAFNDYPLPLHIRGVHESHAWLFKLLAASSSHAEAAKFFQDYMGEFFGLQQQNSDGGNAPVRRFRASYLRLLKGWGFDSNSREGAVMKGWVESRFGLFPTFHLTRLVRFTSSAWSRYVEEKMASRFHNNDIYTQLDLLYEFCQWSLARWFCSGQHHVKLYRGVNNFSEDNLLRGQPHPRSGLTLLRLNNIVSFTAHRSIASEFGDYILEAQVPTVKILFFNDLLPHHALKGEAEYLAIGGDYRVNVSYL